MNTFNTTTYNDTTVNEIDALNDEFNVNPDRAVELDDIDPFYYDEDLDDVIDSLNIEDFH